MFVLDYLNVYGLCTEDSQCDNTCTCAPCSHLSSANWSVYVTAEENKDTNDAANSQCPNLNDYSTCSGQCPDKATEDLTGGAIAGIVVATFVVFVLLGVFFIFTFCYDPKRQVLLILCCVVHFEYICYCSTALIFFLYISYYLFT